MKVLVTGGAGFIGTHLVQALVLAGDHVVVLDNLLRGSRSALFSAEKHGMVNFLEGDIRDYETLESAARGAQRIYHLAAQSNVLGAAADVEYSFSTNVVGTYNALQVARSHGVERVVFASSREVYGDADPIPVSEDQPLNPRNSYGASKVAGEVYCRAFQNSYQLDVSVVRLANVYGAGDRDRVVPIWLDRAHRGSDLELFGGQQVLDLVPVELAVKALRRAGETSLEGQAVNVGSGIGTTLRDLAARIRALPGVESELTVRSARTIEVTRFIADVTRMQTLLGIVPPLQVLTDLSLLWSQGKEARTEITGKELMP